MADRSLDVAKAYMDEREAVGDPLIEEQTLRFQVADTETRLQGVRSMERHAVRQIAAGEQTRTEVAMTRVFAAETGGSVVDDCVQVPGGNGIGKDLPLADFYENGRCFRVIDGADEVYKRSIARSSLDDSELVPEELEHVTHFGER